VRRREFITLLCGAATTWPLGALAQQPERMRRIGVLMALSANDPEAQAFVAAFLQGLQELGWSVGRNAIVDIRWSAGTVYEYSMSGKWLQLLKEIAPGVTRVAVLRDPSLAAGPGQFAAIQSVAPSLGVELRPVDVRDGSEIERAITAFAQSPNSGLIVTGSALAVFHRDLIITLAARHRFGVLV